MIFLLSDIKSTRWKNYFCNGLICKRSYEKYIPGVFSSNFVAVSKPFTASFVALLF